MEQSTIASRDLCKENFDLFALIRDGESSLGTDNREKRMKESPHFLLRICYYDQP